MPRYEKAGEDVCAIVQDALDRWHPDLREAGTTIETLLALPSDPDIDEDGELKRPLVSDRGYPALAKIKVQSARDRAAGSADARLILDGHRWENELGEAERLALVDHELTHLEPKRDKATGAVLLDDNNRPKLRTRPHDWEAGIFAAVCRRHGESAPDTQAVEDVLRRKLRGEFRHEERMAEAGD